MDDDYLPQDPDDDLFDTADAADEVPPENWPADDDAPADDRELIGFPDPYDDDEATWRERVIGAAWCSP